jgi:multidrug efflux pump subunit AcrB
MTIDAEQRDMVLQLDTFVGDVSPEMLYNLVISTRSGPVRLSDISTISTDPSLTTIQRLDGDIVISVEADLENGLQPTSFQPKLEQFAKQYNYPTGLSYKSGGENEENSELIV